MPAAAVIPAPIAYINVVAVKKLVVEVTGAPESSGKPEYTNRSFLIKFSCGLLCRLL